jgi:hypothetical protein
MNLNNEPVRALTPAVRVLRTCGQVVAAMVTVIPAVVGVAHALNINLDGAALATIGAAGVALIAGLQNVLESFGKIPVLGSHPAPAKAASNQSGGTLAPGLTGSGDQPEVVTLGGGAITVTPTQATPETPAPAGLTLAEQADAALQAIEKP